MLLSRLTMWTLAIGLVAVAMAVWPQVPERFPTHYGLDGVADDWSVGSFWGWLALPLVGLAMAAFMEWMMRVAVFRPGAPGLNLPNKEAILALPPDRRAPVLARVAVMTYATAAFCMVAFALIQLGTWTEAHGASGTGWVLAGIGVAVVGPMAALAVGMVAIHNEVDRQQA
ncbi:DUF1648 domain-containing protein [Rubrivirga sp. IMCC43871]|uniref:DUF1648 domain-containing protein n=1 Tax=Rubrivirga sp. IMCC43871 TaxID=3391575 RepID=UPI0039901054